MDRQEPNKEAFKLIVITPFDNYQRGDEVTDQAIVNDILNPDHELHHYDAYVRRVAIPSLDKGETNCGSKRERSPCL